MVCAGAGASLFDVRAALGGALGPIRDQLARLVKAVVERDGKSLAAA
jgi:hypothetical protein